MNQDDQPTTHCTYCTCCNDKPPTEKIQYAYTSHYCEENIYHLAKQKQADPGYALVVFMSNRCRTVPFWRHKPSISAENPSGMVIWDYHVIYIHDDYVYDYDSDVPFPCNVWQYLHEVLHILDTYDLPSSLRRLYRTIAVQTYVEDFASDRSHMLVDGKYLAPPPKTPCIVAKSGETMNLMNLVDMRASDVMIDRPGTLGSVMQETAFIDLCRQMMHSDEKMAEYHRVARETREAEAKAEAEIAEQETWIKYP